MGIFEKLSKIKFQHKEGCKFFEQISKCGMIHVSSIGDTIEASDDHDWNESIDLKFCPYCGVDIDIDKIKQLEIKKRIEELLVESPIKIGDEIYVLPNHYWKGAGLKSKFESVEYDIHNDRLYYIYKGKEKQYACGTWIIDQIQLYTGQKIMNKI